MAGLADLLQWQGMGADQQPMQQPQQAPTSLAESITPDILAKLMEYIQGSVPQYQDDPQRPTDMQSLLISMGAGLMGADDFGTGMSQGMSSFMQNRNILDQAQRGQNTERGMGTALGNYRAASALEGLFGGSGRSGGSEDPALELENLIERFPEAEQFIREALPPGSSPSNYLAVEKALLERSQPEPEPTEPSGPAGSFQRGQISSWNPTTRERVWDPGYEPEEGEDIPPFEKYQPPGNPQVEAINELSKQIAAAGGIARLTEQISAGFLGTGDMTKPEEQVEQLRILRQVTDSLLDRLTGNVITDLP